MCPDQPTPDKAHYPEPDPAAWMPVLEKLLGPVATEDELVAAAEWLFLILTALADCGYRVVKP